MNSFISRNKRDLAPVAVAAAIAFFGAIGLFLTDLSPKSELQPTGITMITASVASQAGVTVVPTETAAR